MIIMKGSKTSFCSSKSAWASERISSKFVDSLGTRLQNVSPALIQGLHVYNQIDIVEVTYHCNDRCLHIDRITADPGGRAV